MADFSLASGADCKYHAPQKCNVAEQRRCDCNLLEMNLPLISPGHCPAPGSHPEPQCQEQEAAVRCCSVVGRRWEVKAVVRRVRIILVAPEQDRAHPLRGHRRRLRGGRGVLRRRQQPRGLHQAPGRPHHF